MFKKLKLIIIIFLISNSLYSQSNIKDIVSGEEYITSSDGIVQIYVNIWGHVKNPGTYLVYDGATTVDVLSQAGGPLDGAKLSSIEIRSKKNGAITNIDLDNYQEAITRLKPYDTLIISQTARSKLSKNSSIFSLLVQLLNLLYTIDKLGD